MPNRSTNLTRDDAATRAATNTVDTYEVEIDLTDSAGNPSSGTFTSTTTVKFAATPGTDTFIDIHPGNEQGATLISAHLNGEEISTRAFDQTDGLTISGLAANNTLVVAAKCSYSNDGQGLNRFIDKPDRDQVYLYTQFETGDAKRMFACFDQPDLKASFTLRVTAPQSWEVIANSTATVEITGSAKVHSFAATPRISTYLVALIAGPYAKVEDTYSDQYGTIPLALYCRGSLEQFLDSDVVFDLTKSAFGFYHQLFGIAYPFEKYDQIFCPEFNAGAMENVAAVTFRDEYVFQGQTTRAVHARRAETIFHEMAHMWFGDLVTMKWWDDLWLNESFATWAANLGLVRATEFTEAWTTFANVEKSKAYRQDLLPSTHPVAGDVENLDSVHANFDAITYLKGASLIKQLVALVGHDQFVLGLRDYFARHAYANAELADLLIALQPHAGEQNLVEWAEEWLRTTGINTLTAGVELADDKIVRCTISQSLARPHDLPQRTHRIVVGIYADDPSGALARTHQTGPLEISGSTTEIPQLKGISGGPLIIVNDDDLTYCALRFDPALVDMMRSRVKDIEKPLPRAQVWSTLWDMTRGAQMRSRDFLACVLDNVGAETTIAVASNLLWQAQTALTFYSDPEFASGQSGWDAFNEQVLAWARAAVPGSDAQLAYVSALTADRANERQRSSVLSRNHALELVRLLTEEPEDVGLPGLKVDKPMRWRVIVAGATAGVLDASAIEAERRRDPDGGLNAEQARAARPLAEAKEDTWNSLVANNRELGNAEARTLAAGFAAPGQIEFQEPYSARYFDTIVDVWAERAPSSEPVATTLAVGLYPLWDVTQEAVDKADAVLERIAGRDGFDGLRRRIKEGQADVKWALAARQFDVTDVEA
jgi:aminopeptidase N